MVVQISKLWRKGKESAYSTQQVTISWLNVLSTIILLIIWFK